MSNDGMSVRVMYQCFKVINSDKRHRYMVREKFPSRIFCGPIFFQTYTRGRTGKTSGGSRHAAKFRKESCPVLLLISIDNDFLNVFCTPYISPYLPLNCAV